MSFDSNAPATPGQQPAVVDSKRPDQPAVRPPQWRRWPVWLLLVLLLCGGGYLIAQRSGSGPKQGTNARKPSQSGRPGAGAAVPVAAARAASGDLGVYLTALGTVTPVYTVTVSSRVVGNLVAVYYKEGQLVKKGDLLAEVDPRPYQAALTQAQGQLIRDQAMLRNARLDLERYKLAFQQHAIPEQTLATQGATVNQDEGIVKADEGAVAAAQVNVDYTKLRSPIDGRVGLRMIDPGNIVQANGATGIAVVTQLQPITVIFPVAENYISEVVKQMQAGHKLRVDALDRQQESELAQGTLLTIDNQIDTATGTVRFRALFANKDNRLFPNEFVNARLLVKTLHHATLIPTACIQRNGDEAYVYVIQPNSTVRSQDINVETIDKDTAAVTGVNPGDILVSDGFDKLQDGVKVVLRRPTVPTANAVIPPQAPGKGAMIKENSDLQINTRQRRPGSEK